MNDKQILDRLESINLSLRQKQDLIDVIKDITASNAGGGSGGTSTDKDALTILVDPVNQTATVNDKQFLISSIDENIIAINNKELYNSLVNANMPIFIKTIGSDFQIAGYVTCTINGEYSIQLSIYTVDRMFVIVVYNR